MSLFLEIQDLHKSYGDGKPVLRGLNMQIETGQFVGLIGLSGAGKSTFLRCLNRLIDPTSGRVLVTPKAIFTSGSESELIDIVQFNKRTLRLWRRKTGMIFQQFNLIKRLSVIQNVLAGSLGYKPNLRSSLKMFTQEEKQQALICLERVGLLDQAYKRADALSGGQQQRVAIARTLMQNPTLILADEPVASLDPKLSRTVLDILKRVCQEDGITAIVSLHTLELTREYSDRVIGLAHGEVAFDNHPDQLTNERVEEVYERYKVYS